MPTRRHGYRYVHDLFLLSVLGLMLGCSTMEPKLTPVDRGALRDPFPSQSQTTSNSEGSLFMGESRRSLLFVDRKAQLLNDVLTVRIVESASASGEATTATERDSSISARLDNFFGFEDTLRNNGVNPETSIEAGMTNNFDGSGATSRRNSFRATISAVVREVFPNGNLYIEGRKEVIINNERQYILVSGVVRPEDIKPDNSITSDLIADARIEYSGKGVIAEKQRPGWLGRVFDVVWPF